MDTAILYVYACMHVRDFPGDAVVRNPPANAGDAGDMDLLPGSESAPGLENGNPLQYSCMGNSMNRGTWWATVHGVTKSWTELSMHPHTCMYAWMETLHIAV